MNHQAPALGGASTSAGSASVNRPLPALHSAWNPYAILPPATKRKIDPKSTIPSRPYLETLGISLDVATERIANKYLQLDPPEGKMSDRRKKELTVRLAEKDKKLVKRAREGDCGLIGRRKRLSLGKEAEHRISYAAVLPVHHLWLGYMAELLQLPIQVPSLTTSAPPPVLSATSVIYPTFATRSSTASTPVTDDLPLNVPTLHTKLTKAEFVGCRLRVKRAKNPSLLGLEGIVLQETQGTFKLVTVKSKVKIVPKEGTIFTLDLPLLSPSPGAVSAELEPIGSRILSFDIYGDAFAFRSSDRVGRKWKAGTSAGGVELS